MLFTKRAFRVLKSSNEKRSVVCCSLSHWHFYFFRQTLKLISWRVYIVCSRRHLHICRMCWLRRNSASFIKQVFVASCFSSMFVLCVVNTPELPSLIRKLPSLALVALCPPFVEQLRCWLTWRPNVFKFLTLDQTCSTSVQRGPEKPPDVLS